MEKALKSQTDYVQGMQGFPLPAYYAHPLTLERMMRAIRMGRAFTVDEFLEIVKEDLKVLNPSVTVTQKEYDEVVVVKPLASMLRSWVALSMLVWVVRPSAVLLRSRPSLL